MDNPVPSPEGYNPTQCAQCGAAYPPAARFCQECGAPLAYRCEACGASNRHGAKFCLECGTALSPSRSVATPPSPPPATSPTRDVPAAAAEDVTSRIRAGYTPAYLAEKILTTRGALEGERKVITVLFADVVDSSAFAQRIDPERLHQLMGQVLQLVAETIHRYEGTVNQYLGDGVMALFGAPFALEDHGVRAVQAALAVQETIRGYGAQFQREHGMGLSLRIGINTGPVVVGRIGDDLRMDYTAVGNTTHIASRLQALAEPGAILVSDDTHRLVEGYVTSEPLGPIEVRGQRDRVNAYRVTGRRRWRSRLEMTASRGLTQLAGRRRELALLHDCLRRVQAGHGQVVGVAGEPGLGKSRLLYELHGAVADEAVDWLEGHCLAYSTTLPYGPVLQILRSLFHIEDGDNALQIQAKLRDGVLALERGIAPMQPFLEALFGLPGSDEALRHLDRQHRRQQTLEMIRAVVVAASRQRPLVLVCENLHWIDQSSEDVLAFMAGSLTAVPILILTTHRTGYTVRWADKPHYTQIALERLARLEVEEMLRALLGAQEFPAEFLQFVRDKADGNPLFIEEVTQALVERDLLVREDGRLRLSEGAVMDWPATIQDIVQARIDRLDENVKDTIQIAAIIGREFDLRLLGRVSGRPADIAGHLEALKRLDLIHEAHFFPRLEYRFKHAVIQDVVYKSLLAPRRQALHTLVGRSIEELNPDQIEEHAVVLAHHYAHSSHPESAIKYALLAGDRAARVYANAEASAYYDQALALTRALTATPERNRTEIDATIKRASVGTTREALEQDRHNLEQARTLAEALKDEPRLARVLYWLGRVAYVRGAFQPATDYSEQSLAIADRRHDEDLAAPPVNLMGRSYYLMGEYARAAELLVRSVEQMHHLGNTTEEATAAGFAGVALAAIGDFERALAYADRGLRLAEKLGNPFVQAAAYNYRAVAYCHRGAGREAIADCQEARKVAERAGDRFRIYLLQFYEGQAYMMIGDPARARELLEDSIGLAKQLGTTTLLAWGQGLLATSLLELGRPDAVPPLCEEAISLAEQTRDRLANALAHRTLAEAVAELTPADPERAERLVLDAMRIQHEVGSRPELARSHVTYARLLQRWGRRADAKAHLTEALDMFRAMDMRRDLAEAERLAADLA
jgi:class 3 adenylate cyclase/tetratricopeptide (TPR) repeat protein